MILDLSCAQHMMPTYSPYSFFSFPFLLLFLKNLFDSLCISHHAPPSHSSPCPFYLLSNLATSSPKESRQTIKEGRTKENHLAVCGSCRVSEHLSWQMSNVMSHWSGLEASGFCYTTLDPQRDLSWVSCCSPVSWRFYSVGLARSTLLCTPVDHRWGRYCGRPTQSLGSRTWI